MTGFVYAISGGEGRVKIGWSSDPFRRLAKLLPGLSGNRSFTGWLKQPSNKRPLFTVFWPHGVSNASGFTLLVRSSVSLKCCRSQTFVLLKLAKMTTRFGHGAKIAPSFRAMIPKRSPGTR